MALKAIGLWLRTVRSQVSSGAAAGVALLVVIGPGISGASAYRGTAPSGTYDRSLVHDGLTRAYRVHVPPSYDPSTPSALVLALHGGGGRGQGMEALTGFTPLSDRKGFIVVYPTALNGLWKDGVERTQPDTRDIDDVGFVATLIDTLRQQYTIDSSRVFVTGISNGGHMAYRLATELSDRISAAGVVGATMEAAYAATHSPQTPVSVIYFHGRADPLRYFEGGGAPGGDTMSARAMTEWWVEKNGCPSTPLVENLPDAVNDGTTVTRELYGPGRDGAEVAFYIIEGGGHTWPGGLQYLPESTIGKTCRDINASELMWEFFADEVVTSSPCVTMETVNLSSSPTFDGEPFITVDPFDSQNLVAGWMALEGGVITIRTRASSDAGKTWTPAVSIPHLSAGWGSADVSIAFDRAGAVYLTFVDFGRSSYGGALALVKSSDGGATWGPAAIVHRLPDTPFSLIDRPWIAVDASPGPRSGTIYVTSMTVYTQASNRHVFVHRSEDGGGTWRSVQLDDATLPAGPYLSYGVPSVGADGRLAVAYLSDRGCGTAGATACLVVATSDDGGQTFERRVAAAVYQPQGIRGFRFYGLAADPVRPGRLAITWMDARNGDADIYFRSTTDGGAVWGPVVRVNDDPLGNAVQQDIPWVTISPEGVIGVAWRDRRRSSGDWKAPFDIYMAESKDGAVFADNLALTPGPATDPGTTVGTTSCCNSFLGIAVSAGRTHAIWSDYRAGNWDVHAVVSAPQPAPQIDPAKMYFRKGNKQINIWLRANTLPLFVEGVKLEISSEGGASFAEVPDLVVKNSGNRIQSKGRIANQPIGVFFPDGARRTIRISGPTCAVTELTVKRVGQRIVIDTAAASSSRTRTSRPKGV